MSAGTSELFCLIVCFLICSSEAQKIIRPEKIKAELGQDVILPCKVPININIKAVEWIRPDQDPEYVLFYRDGLLDPHNQHPSYQNRVDLQDKEMKDGNFSLILNNAMKIDTGIYECRVFEEGKIDPISNISLVVHLPAQKIITAELGQDVILPCKVPKKNVNIIAVQWSRPDQDLEYVLFYKDGHLDPEHQHPSYQNRVDLQDKDMKDGDFSLILKNVTKNDTGTYECHVFEKGKRYPISVTYPEVHLPGEKFEGDQDGIIRDGGNKDGGNKTVIIVGSVVGVIVLLAVVYVGVLIYRRLMRQNPHLPVSRVEPPPIEMPAVPESPVEPPTASEALMEAPAEEQSENVQ